MDLPDPVTVENEGPVAEHVAGRHIHEAARGHRRADGAKASAEHTLGLPRSAECCTRPLAGARTRSGGRIPRTWYGVDIPRPSWRQPPWLPWRPCSPWRDHQQWRVQTTGSTSRRRTRSRGARGRARRDDLGGEPVRLTRSSAWPRTGARSQIGPGVGRGPLRHRAVAPTEPCGSPSTWASRIGRLTADGDLSEFCLSDRGSMPTGITTGPDGALVRPARDRAIGRSAPVDGEITEWPTISACAPPL